MAVEIKMPALSPTMEEGTLAKWLVKVGDTVNSGEIMAEIETDKATMEFEAVDEGTIVAILVEEGSENVAVGTVIAMLAEEGEDIGDVSEPSDAPAPSTPAEPEPAAEAPAAPATAPAPAPAAKPTPASSEGRIVASPLAKRIAEQKGVDLSQVTGSGPNGRIVKADVEGSSASAARTASASASAAQPAAAPTPSMSPDDGGAPYAEAKLNNVRKVIARRLTEAKQQIPHIYLTVDVQLDALLKLRKELNASLEADGVKLSVNDLIIKALARSLQREPQCNVSFQGDVMHEYSRQDISVAVAAPSGLITPVIRDAGRKGLAEISTEMKELAGKARDGKLMPHEYQGGTASLSNLGMFGTKHFDAVINSPQGMILAVGAGEQRPAVVDGALGIATVMTVTGSFDHRAIDGVDGAKLLAQFQSLIENPMGLVV